MSCRELGTLQYTYSRRVEICYRALNKQIQRSLLFNIRAFNTERIKEMTEQNKGPKVLAREESVRQNPLTKLKTEAIVLREVKRFNRHLYTSITEPVERLAKDEKAKLTRQYTDYTLMRLGLPTNSSRKIRHRARTES